MEEIEKAADEATSEPDRLPLFLLVGAALGALVTLIVAVLRRPAARPAAESDWGEALPEPLGAPTPLPGGALGAHVLRTAPARAPSGKAAPELPARSTRWPTATKYVIGVILFLSLVGLVVFSRSVIPTLIFAALIAFIVAPIVRFFERKLRLKKGLAVGLTYLLVILILILIPLILVPAIINAINSFLSVDYQSMGDTILDAVDQVKAAIGQIPVVNAVLGPILDSLRQSLEAITSARVPEPVSYTLTVSEAGNTLAEMVGRLAVVLGPVISAITTVIFMVLISIYLSMTTEQIDAWWPKLIPPGYEPELSGLFRRINDIWSSFLRGELTLMILIGTTVYLGNLVLGNQNALLLGIISGFMELIPNIGPAIALIPGVLMALLFGSSWIPVSNLVFALIVLAFYLGVQVLENQLVVPKVMGDALDLPPLVVILGVFVGGATIGILGVLLAAPAIATGVELFGYLYNKILEPPPITGPPEEKLDLFASVAGAVKNLTKRVKLPSGLRLRRREAPPGVIPAAAQAADEPARVLGEMPDETAGNPTLISATPGPADLVAAG